ncbi:MAG: sterol desaturase family protein [Arcicella sp.]|jgi:sterol desaturase/sphingolipid hydroxylase (fatty acid hydroxylase superfamily)|nr:sterol desaturase family protein [Arcicella sp.]
METILPSGILIFLITLLRYLFIAGLAFFIFYYAFKNSFQKIQARFPKVTDYQREIGYSVLSCVIFGVVGYIAYQTPFYQFSLAYSHIHDYPIWYFWVSILLMILLHDAYFYWTHRLIHHKLLFKYFHALHHKSHNPSPWAAFAFDPLEAVINGCFQFVMMMVIPAHFNAVAIFYLISMIVNVYGHLGYEIYPQWFLKHRLGKWLNTSTAHNYHHHFGKGNYGFYFTFWDKWMGTERTE